MASHLAHGLLGPLALDLLQLAHQLLRIVLVLVAVVTAVVRLHARLEMNHMRQSEPVWHLGRVRCVTVPRIAVVVWSG